MDEEQVTPMQTALKWGVYTGIALIIFDLVLYVLGMKSADGSNPVQYLGFLFFIGFVVMAIKSHVQSNGYMSYGQGLGAGLLTSLIAGALIGVYVYLFATVIAPEFMDGAMDGIKDQWEAQGMSDEQIEQAEGFAGMFMSPGVMAISSIFSYGFIGLIISLIAAAVFKRD